MAIWNLLCTSESRCLFVVDSYDSLLYFFKIVYDGRGVRLARVGESVLGVGGTRVGGDDAKDFVTK